MKSIKSSEAPKKPDGQSKSKSRYSVILTKKRKRDNQKPEENTKPFCG